MFIPFHIFNAIPRTISNNKTLPKLSVMAAILLSGDKEISSPCLLLSGNPNLLKVRWPVLFLAFSFPCGYRDLPFLQNLAIHYASKKRKTFISLFK